MDQQPQPSQNGGSRRGNLPVVSVGSAIVSITMCALFVSGTLTLHTPDLGPKWEYRSYKHANNVSVRNYSAWCDTLHVLPIDSVDYKIKKDFEFSWTSIKFDVGTNTTSQVTSRTMTTSSNQPTGRIVGGDAHNIKEFPFFVSLKRYGWHSCGGSLLTSNFVVSAAHCFEKGSPNEWTITAGVSQQNHDGFSAQVNVIIIHNDYNRNTLESDIALLRTKTLIPEWTDLIQPACVRWIEPIELVANDPVYVIGMGYTEEEAGQGAGQLLGASLSVLTAAYCNDQFGANYIKDGMLCAGYPPGGRDACQADSGGPLLHNGNGTNDYLIGLVSFGVGCARKNFGGGYTSVKSYRQWIASTVQHVDLFL